MFITSLNYAFKKVGNLGDTREKIFKYTTFYKYELFASLYRYLPNGCI